MVKGNMHYFFRDRGRTQRDDISGEQTRMKKESHPKRSLATFLQMPTYWDVRLIGPDLWSS